MISCDLIDIRCVLFALGKLLLQLVDSLGMKRLMLIGTSSQNLISYGFFHEVNFTLLQHFKKLIREWNDHLSLLEGWNFIFQILEGMSAASHGHLLWLLNMLQRWLNQEWISLCGEVNVFAKGARCQETCITLHLQEVILSLPYEWNVFELIDAVPLIVDTISGRGRRYEIAKD